MFSKLALLLIWSKDFVPFFLVLLDSSAFLIYNILTFDQKKKKELSVIASVPNWLHLLVL
jgi:hypothetical protein